MAKLTWFNKKEDKLHEREFDFGDVREKAEVDMLILTKLLVDDDVVVVYMHNNSGDNVELYGHLNTILKPLESNRSEQVSSYAYLVRNTLETFKGKFAIK